MGEITGSWGEMNDIDDEVIDAIALDIMNSLDNQMLRSIAKQAETSVSLEDITKMCAEVNALTPYSCGFPMEYIQQPDLNLYNTEFEIKFGEELKEPETVSDAAKYDMAMKVVK